MGKLEPCLSLHGNLEHTFEGDLSSFEKQSSRVQLGAMSVSKTTVLG